MLTQCFQNVHFCTSGSGGVLNVRKCSAMYFNLYSTFPSAICCPYHFTWFLLLLSVPRCHSSEHFAMELTTFQHILEQRGLEGIAQRACQHHADKWTSFFRTGDHETEFQQLIDLAIKVQTMRKMFADGDAMMEAMLEAEYLQTVIKTTIGKAQDEAIADSKPKARPRSDFNLGQAGVPIDGKFWTQNLDKCFFYGQKCFRRPERLTCDLIQLRRSVKQAVCDEETFFS